MNKALSILFIALGFFVAQSQTLKPSIGLGALPSDNSTVCAIPVYTGNFNASGLQAGDTIPHFQLYDVNGNTTDILPVLQTGKPLLLIAGAYTCPVFRQKIAKINQVAAAYAGQINIFVVYVVEAHPKNPDVSPYSGSIWVTSENQNEGVLYNQPTTYGERKQLINTMLANPLYTLSVPVLIDGPCNAWWQNFGPAPNNAYLIQPNGVVYKKHGWFDKAPDNIANDIDALLSIPTTVQEHQLQNVVVYPNPVSSQLQFQFADRTSGNISIHDASGRTVLSGAIANTNYCSINTENLSPGIYFYTLVTDKTIKQGKITKQ